MTNIFKKGNSVLKRYSHLSPLVLKIVPKTKLIRVKKKNKVVNFFFCLPGMFGK
jgi:hypothetical protein